MASPPFNINQSSPGDSDIVSQYPLNERTTRDIIESWLLIDHNNLGQHAKVSIPWAAAPAAPGSNLTLFYVDTSGVFHAIDASYDRVIGLPPGSVIYTAGSSLDAGFLAPDGSAVSRTVFSSLFSRIGTTYGVGDGSTTFNLPKINGRVIAAEDDGTTLSATYYGTAPVLGAKGGVDHFTILQANLPDLSLPVTDPGHSHSVSGGTQIGNATGQSGGGGQGTVLSPGTIGIVPNTTGITVRTGGSGTSMSSIQPTIILKAQIKF